MTRCICLLVPLCLVSLPTLVAGEEKSTAEDAIKAAIALLEGRKANAADKAEEEKIARAIDGLQRMLGDKAPAGEAAGPMITPQMLKKLSARFANYDARKGELTLTYDFTNREQLKDFDAGGDKPTILRGGVQLEAGQQMTHVVRFKTVLVAGSVAATNMPGEYLKTSGGIQCGYRRLVGSHTRAFVAAGEKQSDTTQILSDSLLNKPLELRLTATGKRVSLRLGGQEIGFPIEHSDVGQVSLHAPSGKTWYGKVTITGTVDPAWAKEFFTK